MSWKDKFPKENRYYENENGILYCGDCLDIMKQMPENSVDLIVTSPPYDNLRDYKGYVFEFEKIAKEIFKITRKGGVVIWVVGDATINGSETGTSFRQALYFKDECGFKLHDTMIYAKNNYVPLTHNRYEQQFEYMFVFSKGKPKTFNPIKIPTKCVGKKKKFNFENASSFEKKSAIRSSKNRMDVIIIKKEKIKPNIWFYNVGCSQTTKDKIAYKHPATFPEQLAYDHIISWSNSNDIVLDPMCGSGTTMKQCEKLNRRWIGIEISEEYCEIAKKRIKSQEVLI